MITATEEKYNLLIVDDEIEILKTIKRQFRNKYNVFTANDAQNALLIMEEKHMQVVITDQRMPGMSGTEFLNIIKKKYPDALKLIITGYSDIEAVIGAINEGQIFRYITKPWNPIELESILTEAFHKYELITRNKKLSQSLEQTNIELEAKVKKRTEELEVTNIKLKELNIEKNKYIGIVAHDLRNPIGNSKGYSELLLDVFDDISRDEKFDYISTIKKQCEFALNLINDVLDTSKIEAGIFDISKSRQDYIEFIKTNVNQNKMFAKNKSQQLVLDTKEELCVLSFDPNKIQQVLDNLIGNAIKFSLPNTEIKIEVLIQDNQLITNIHDKGQGIPESEIQSIFEAYKVSSVKSTDEEKSTGLGLSIVKKIINAHNGQIFVNSETGKGSSFTYTLPLLD